MKRFFNWQVGLGILLIILSAIVYLIHFLLFKDAHHIFIYLVGDIAFVFLEVLFVTLILHQLLKYREKQSLLKKLNMVIGTFFSEVGVELLKLLSEFDEQAGKRSKKVIIETNWSDKRFKKAKEELTLHKCSVDIKKGVLETLKTFLLSKRQFLLTLLENPNLLEHESFTDFLLAAFHLTEELSFRKSLKGLPDTDYQHLCGDIKRAYNLLIIEWLVYMKHLKKDYPYLFSLAVRTNPFDENASIEVTY